MKVVIILTYEYKNGVLTIGGIEFLGTEYDFQSALLQYNHLEDSLTKSIFNKKESIEMATIDELRELHEQRMKELFDKYKSLKK